MISPADDKIQAVFLRAHLKLLAVGMSHSRLKKGDILAKAGRITGKTYKRGQYQIARDDLGKFLEENS